jgi:hypothetical protein
MKRRFRYDEVVEVEPAPVEETFKLHCKKCGYGSNNYGELMSHIKQFHPKQV